jgi:hypothetical protein
MASDPSELGDEAAGDELRGVSAMVRQGVEVVGGEWIEGGEYRKRWRVARQQRRRKRRVRDKRGYSRLAFFDVCIFVTASEGEELVVDIIGRHGERDSRGFRDEFRVGEAVVEAETVSLGLP